MSGAKGQTTRRKILSSRGAAMPLLLLCLGFLLLYVIVSLLVLHLHTPQPVIELMYGNSGLTSSTAKLAEPRRQHDQPTLRYYPGHPVAAQLHDTRPALSTLIRNDMIVGDVQFLLDFAIIGFGKAGTTTMMDWLATAAPHQIAIFSREVYDLMKQQPAKLVQSLYRDLPADPHLLRGYKNPLEVWQPHVLEYYRRYWPRTKLLIGLRHPVLWFESLYNFRLQTLPANQTLPDPNHLIGACYADRYQTCTEKGNFAYALMHLGKTSGQAVTRLAQSIVEQQRHVHFNVSAVPYLPNPVFLYHVEEMTESPDDLAAAVASFLGLHGGDTLPPLPHRRPGLDKTETGKYDRPVQQINICHPLYQPVRAELLRLGKQGAAWIADEFLSASPDTIVVTHNFRSILHRWAHDPCDTRHWMDGEPIPDKHDPIIQQGVPLRLAAQGG